MKLKQPNIKGLDSINLIKKDVKVTPMISQYLEVKERHKDYLLFYRIQLVVFLHFYLVFVF